MTARPLAPTVPTAGPIAPAPLVPFNKDP